MSRVASSATAAAPPAASKSAGRPWAAGYVAAPTDDDAGDGVLSPLAQRNGPATVRSESRVQFATSGSNGGSGAKSLSGSYFHPNNSSFSILSGSSKMPSHIVAEDLIFRGAKRKPTLGQSIQQFYLSVTHLHFGNLGIVGDVEPLKLCANLRVLYVYENRLTSLKGLGSLHRLTHLYAQENRIESLEDFEAPPSLTQLHLGSNRLSSIRGLDGCTCLAELHLENQKPPHASAGSSAALPMLVPLPKPVAEEVEAEAEAEEEEEEGGEASKAAHGAAEAAAGAAAAYGDDDDGPPPLTIDHSSLMAIAPSLLKLNVSQCAVDDDALEPLIVLQRLQVLDARSNQLESMARLQQFTVRLPELRTLRLQGNPLAADPKFRERIIVFTHRVDDLDGKPIKPTERAFLLERAKRQASAGTRRTSPAAAVARVTSAPPQPPQQLGVSIPSAQSYNLGRGHGLVGTTPGGFFEVNGAGQSASLPSGTRRPWARSPHAV